MNASERICAALDFPALPEAEAYARVIAPHVGVLKVGLELFAAEGPAAVRAVAALGRPVFLDLKLHDIPNTVEGAARSAAAHAPKRRRQNQNSGMGNNLIPGRRPRSRHPGHWS